jgi:hypothetical protein
VPKTMDASAAARVWRMGRSPRGFRTEGIEAKIHGEPVSRMIRL